MQIMHDYLKYGACVALAFTTLIVSAYALFLIWHVIIIFSLSHMLTIAITAEIFVLTVICILYLHRHFSGICSIKPVLAMILLLWLIPQLSLIAYTECEYNAIEAEYQDFAAEKLKTGENTAAISWNISKKYLETFSSAQNDPKTAIPLRAFYSDNNVLKANFLLHFYLFTLDGLEKMTVIKKQGNCSEFAGAVSYLVRITLDTDTKTVFIYGYDHKAAIVSTDSGWLVLDPLKTTPDYPVEISGYISYIKNRFPEISGQITGLDIR